MTVMTSKTLASIDLAIENRLDPRSVNMSSSMLTFALLRNSNDLHIYKDLYGEKNKPKKTEKLPLNYNKNLLPEFQRHLERFSVV